MGDASILPKLKRLGSMQFVRPAAAGAVEKRLDFTSGQSRCMVRALASKRYATLAEQLSSIHINQVSGIRFDPRLHRLVTEVVWAMAPSALGGQTIEGVVRPVDRDNQLIVRTQP